MGWQQVWPRFLRCVWLHRLLDDGALFEVATSDGPLKLTNHDKWYCTGGKPRWSIWHRGLRLNSPEVLNFHSRKKDKGFTRIWPPWVLAPYVPKFQEYLKRVSLKRNPEPFTFCFAGRTPSRVAELRDREFAGTQWLGHVTLFAEDLCNVHPSVYTETRNKKFHVMDQILLGQRRGGSDTSPTTRLIKHWKNQWNSTGMDVEVSGSQWHVSEGFKKS